MLLFRTFENCGQSRSLRNICLTGLFVTFQKKKKKKLTKLKEIKLMTNPLKQTLAPTCDTQDTHFSASRHHCLVSSNYISSVCQPVTQSNKAVGIVMKFRKGFSCKQFISTQLYLEQFSFRC